MSGLTGSTACAKDSCAGIQDISETYGMMLAGVGVVGMLARRRQLGKKA